MLTKTRILSFFTIECIEAAEIRALSGLVQEHLMINSLIEDNGIVLTFEYQDNFIKSAIDYQVLRAPLRHKTHLGSCNGCINVMRNNLL